MARTTLTIRLTAAEKQTLELFAAERGKPLSVWLRQAALTAAGGLASEWRTKKNEGPAWVRVVAKEVRRAIRTELNRAAEAKRARVDRRARRQRA